MSSSLIKGLVGAARQSGHGKQSASHLAVRIGIVTNNKDEEDRYRVRVKMPSMQEDGKEESFWARICTPLASLEYGAFFLPEVDDEVLVAFCDGHHEEPVVIGGLWNEGSTTVIPTMTFSPDDVDLDVSNNAQDGKNDIRAIRSRMMHHLLFLDKDGEGAVELRGSSGATLVIQDKSGEEKIQLYDMNREQWLEIDVPEKKITLQTDTGEIYIKAKATITMECEDFILNAKTSIKIDSGDWSKWNAGGDIHQESGGKFDQIAGGNMKLEAPKIDLNP